MWTPEVVVDAERARALIGRRFPEFGASRLRRLGQGWDNAAYLVDERAVFRFPQRGIAAPLVATEVAVLPLLAPHLPLAIPDPRWIGEPQSDYPWRFAGYPLLPGTPIDVAAPDDAARSRFAPALGAFLRALHALDPLPLREAGLPPDRIGRLDPGKRLPQSRERLAALEHRGALSATEARAVREILERDAPASETQRLTVVHGDLYARHILLDDQRAAVAIIDWGDVHFGDPAVDLAIVHELLPPHAIAAFYEAYGPIEETTWKNARWRATHHAALAADYGLAIGDEALARGGLEALHRILAANEVR